VSGIGSPRLRRREIACCLKWIAHDHGIFHRQSRCHRTPEDRSLSQADYSAHCGRRPHVTQAPQAREDNQSILFFLRLPSGRNLDHPFASHSRIELVSRARSHPVDLVEVSSCRFFFRFERQGGRGPSEPHAVEARLESVISGNAMTPTERARQDNLAIAGLNEPRGHTARFRMPGPREWRAGRAVAFFANGLEPGRRRNCAF
jgi:hypothetical protein